MDTNGVNFQLLNDADDFKTDSREGCQWDDEKKLFRLKAQPVNQFATNNAQEALQQWQLKVPKACDEFWQIATLSQDKRQLVYHQKTDGSADSSSFHTLKASALNTTPSNFETLALSDVTALEHCLFTDLSLGGDGRLSATFKTDPVIEGSTEKQGIMLVHLVKKWQAICYLPQVAHLSCVDNNNRIWCLSDQYLMLCEGQPLPQAYTRSSTSFEPVQTNLSPLAWQWQQGFDSDYFPLAMCCDDKQLYILSYHKQSYQQVLLIRGLNNDKDSPITILKLPDLPFAIDISTMQTCTLALMLAIDSEKPNHKDLPVVNVPLLRTSVNSRPPNSRAEDVLAQVHSALDTGIDYDIQNEASVNTEQIAQAGDRRINLNPQRFVQHTQADVCFIDSLNEGTYYLSDKGIKRLYALPQTTYSTKGTASINRAVDSEKMDCVWDRLYLEAYIPSGCSLHIELKAYNDNSSEMKHWIRQPAPLLQPKSSDIPYYTGRFDTQRSDQGLYEILVQRDTGFFRELKGRFLEIKVNMSGDGRGSPAISVIRAYYNRFSWQQSYLPEHFHPDLYAVPANKEINKETNQDTDERCEASGADVRERMLASLLGLMSPIEGRIEQAQTLIQPMSAPIGQLATIAQMVGAALPVHWPEHRQRQWLSVQGKLQQQRGTYAGLCLALDVATDGALSKGQIVVVENYRLRRTLATALGIDMSDDQHPLTLGVSQSGNSIVGESLILSQEQNIALLGLFAPDIQPQAVNSQTNNQAVQALEQLFEQYANQISVVIHDSAREHLVNLSQIITQWLPAHIRYSVIESDQPFVLGLSPLLGIDTYLIESPNYQSVKLDSSHLSRESLLTNQMTFS
jgi:hypothetical protein